MPSEISWGTIQGHIYNDNISDYIQAVMILYLITSVTNSGCIFLYQTVHHTVNNLEEQRNDKLHV